MCPRPAQVGLLGGLISRQLVVHLLNHIRSFSDWAQCLVLDIVTRYQPASEAERFDMLEVRECWARQGGLTGLRTALFAAIMRSAGLAGIIVPLSIFKSPDAAGMGLGICAVTAWVPGWVRANQLVLGLKSGRPDYALVCRQSSLHIGQL